MERKELKPIIEALVFASDHPLTVERIAGVVEGVDKAEIREAVKELAEEYAAEERGSGLILEQVAGGWQIRTRADLTPWVKRLFKTGLQRVSRAAMETLAIVAYKQPVTRAELESIRGVDSSGVFKTLMDKRLIKVVGRKEVPGRPPVYGTTKDFLEVFDLKNLQGLPTLKELELPTDLEGEEGEITLGALEALETVAAGAEPEAESTEEDARLLEELDEAAKAAKKAEKEAIAATKTESGDEEAEENDTGTEGSKDDNEGATSKDTLAGGDSVETQGGADDPRGEGSGKPPHGD